MNEVKVVEGISDHEAVLTNMNLRAKVNSKKPRKVLLFKKENRDQIEQGLKDLRNHYLENGMQKSVSEEWEFIKATIMNTVQKNIPMKNLKSGKGRKEIIEKEAKNI